jgi:heme/copper-type cytochrome/quinol oxidase subunit 3
MMEKNKLGMVFFISSEAIFFILLILAYLVLHNNVMLGEPTAATSLDPLKTGIFSLFLLASSFTIWRAEKNLRTGNGYFKRWLAATILLGGFFLLGQGLEWRNLIRQGITISVNTFGTTFYTMTGFHGLHVLAGLVGLVILLGMSVFGSSRGSKSPGLTPISYYWHFVDAVWVIIFSVVYLRLL